MIWSLPCILFTMWDLLDLLWCCGLCRQHSNESSVLLPLGKRSKSKTLYLKYKYPPSASLYYCKCWAFNAWIYFTSVNTTKYSPNVFRTDCYLQSWVSLLSIAGRTLSENQPEYVDFSWSNKFRIVSLISATERADLKWLPATLLQTLTHWGLRTTEETWRGALDMHNHMWF